MLSTIVTQPQNYLLLVGRVSGLFLVAPVLSGRSIPVLIRVALVLLVAWVLFPIHALNASTPPLQVPALVISLATEIGVGLVVGFAAALIFATFQMAGGFIGTQIGFGILTLFDPARQQQVSLVDQFYTVLATLLFLLVNGHHMVVMALDRTFRVVPLGAAIHAEAVALPLGRMLSEVFAAALQLALPVLAVLFMADLALGLLARAVPQVNVFFVGLPLKMLVGLLALSLALPATLTAMGTQMDLGIRNTLSLVRAL